MAHLHDGDAEAVLRDFATRHRIQRLALFGSALRGEETPASDDLRQRLDRDIIS